MVPDTRGLLALLPFPVAGLINFEANAKCMLECEKYKREKLVDGARCIMVDTMSSVYRGWIADHVGPCKCLDCCLRNVICDDGYALVSTEITPPRRDLPYTRRSTRLYHQFLHQEAPVPASK